MIKLLKIASFAAIILAAASVVVAGIAIYRGSDAAREREEFISQKTIIDEVKDIIGDGNVEQEKTSPLVGHAKELALRIDPPPPPPPPRPPEKRDVTQKTDTKPDTKTVQEITPPVNRNYKLVGTCRYEKFPEKSIAMIDVVSEGIKLLRQGDLVGMDVIEEIRDGSIVVSQNGRERIYYMPREPEMKSLLKGEGSTVTATLSDVRGIQPGRGSVPTATGTRAVNRNVRDRIRPASSSPGTSSGADRFSSRSVPAPKVLSPEEQKKQMERSISNIKNIISETQASAVSEEQKKKDTKALESLLKLLETESKDEDTSKSASSTNENAIPKTLKEKKND